MNNTVMELEGTAHLLDELDSKYLIETNHLMNLPPQKN